MARDQWNRAHYWRIFRLACCQRKLSSPRNVLAYLETLTQSFNPRLASVAPKQTALLFQRDLEAIITDAAVSEPRWGAFPFLETELSIIETNSLDDTDNAGGVEGKLGRGSKTSQPLPFLRRKLNKHLSFVGDDLKFGLSIHSHLPRKIEVNGIRLYLVTFDKYEYVYRRNGIVTEDDAFRILTIDASDLTTMDGDGNVMDDSPHNNATIQPGKNNFSFTWQPQTPTSYVLATIEIQWKEASFFYDSALLRKPMLGLDIQPSAPTQTIELNPLFLIPGHVQNVRLVFHSGSDVIREGRVKFICSEGLQVVPPKTDPQLLESSWSDECVIGLEECEPGKKIVITTLVKSASMKLHSGDTIVNTGDDTAAESSVQTMRAKVETFYHHQSYHSVMSNSEEPNSSPMNTLLEAMVTTLDRPALTVDDADAFLFPNANSNGEDRVMVHVSLQCNTPVPFYIKEWHLDLPPPLVVEKEGDLNEGMFKHAPVKEGEVLLFGFRCLRISSPTSTDTDVNDSALEGDGNKSSAASARPMLRVVLQDDFGKTFLQVLPVNLEDIYKRLRKEDTYSAESYAATAVLTCAAEEGTVGHPVLFCYNLNLKSLMEPKRRGMSSSASVASEAGRPILYTILSEGSDWIVSGKMQGLIDLSSLSSPGAGAQEGEEDGDDTMSIQFRGIPTQSGILRNFPELFLEYLPPSGVPTNNDMTNTDMPNNSTNTNASANTPPLPSSSPPITVQCRNPDCFKSMAYTTSTSLAVPAGIDEF